MVLPTLKFSCAAYILLNNNSTSWRVMKKLFICVMLSLVVLVSQAEAGRRTFFTYSTSCQYPVKEVVVVNEVITPVAVPVLVPAFQFQYVPPCVTPLAAPALAPTPTVPLQQSSDEHVKALARALLAEMTKVESQDNGPPMAVFGQVPVQKNFAGVLQARCATCHTGSTAKGGMQMFLSPGVFNHNVDRNRILRSVEERRMPLDPVTRQPYQLPADELAILRQGN